MKRSARKSGIFLFIPVIVIYLMTLGNICFAQSAKLKKIKTISKVNNYAITDWYEGSSGKFAVAVQDLHANYAAQKVYAPFFTDLFNEENEFNIKFIGVEGTNGLIDTSFASSYPDKNIRKIISDRLLKNGFISGFECFSVNADQSAVLYGIDDRERYLKNTELYFRISRDLKTEITDAKRVIEYYLQSVASVCEETLTPDGLDLYRHFKDFHEFKISHIQFAEYLKQLSGDFQVDLSGYNQLNLMFSLWNVQKQIDPAELESEKNLMLTRVKPVFSGDDYSKLLRYNMSFSVGRISATAFYNLFYYYMEKYSVDVPADTNLSKMLQLVQLADSIKEPLLNKELYSIVKGIFDLANWDINTRNLFSITTMLYVMDNMLDLKASRWQYDFYESSYETWSVRDIYAALKNMTVNRFSVVSSETELKNVEYLISLAQRFYQEAVKRDANMFANASYMNNTLQGDTMVFITGGFHSEGITSILREHDISYVLVTPRVSAERLSSVYDSVMLNKISSFDTMLSPMQTRLIPSSNFNNLINPENRAILMAKWAVYAGVLESIQNKEEYGLDSEQLAKRFAARQEEWLKVAEESLHISLDPLVERGVISEAFVLSRIDELRAALDRVEYDFERSRVFEKSLAIPLLIKDEEPKEVIVNVKESTGDPAATLEVFDNLDIIKLDKFIVEIWPKEAFIALNELNRLIEHDSRKYSLEEKQNFVVLLDMFGVETLEKVMHTFTGDDMKDLLDIVPSRSQIQSVVNIIGIDNATRLFSWDPRGFFNMVYIGSKYDMSIASDQLVMYVDQLLSERATFRSRDKTIPVFLVQDASQHDLTEWFSYMIERDFDMEYWSEVLSTNEIFLKGLSPAGTVIGLLSARYHSEGRAVVVDTIETSSNVRGIGIGRDLIKEVVNRSMQAGFDGRVVLVPKSDSKAFYRSLGFTVHPNDPTYFILTPDKARKLLSVKYVQTDEEAFSLNGENEKIIEYQNEPILDSINHINELLGIYEQISKDDLIYISAQLMRIQASDEKEAEKIVEELMLSEASFERILTSLYDSMVDLWMSESGVNLDDAEPEKQEEYIADDIPDDIAKRYGVEQGNFKIVNDNLGDPFVAVPLHDGNPSLPVVIKPIGQFDIEEWFSYYIDHEIQEDTWNDIINEDTFSLQAVAPNGKIVGLALGIYDEQEDSIRIKVIETAAPVRGYGVASAMVKEMARLSYRAGFNGKVILNSSDESVQIYKRIGFKSFSTVPGELILMPKEAYDLLDLGFKPSTYLTENIDIFDDSNHVPEIYALTRLRSLLNSYYSLYLWDREFLIDQLKQAFGLSMPAAIKKLDSIMKNERSFRQAVLQLYGVMFDQVSVNIQGDHSFAINVLPADIEDIEEWFSYDIRREFVRDHWLEALAADNVVLFKAVSPSGRIVGLTAAEFDPSDKSYSILRAETCITARYMGAGTSLISELASLSIEQGYDGTLKVEPRRGTENFFTSLGFQKDGNFFVLTPAQAAKLNESQSYLRLGRKYADLLSTLNKLRELLDQSHPITRQDKSFLISIIDELYDFPDDSRDAFLDNILKSDDNARNAVLVIFDALTDALIGMSNNMSSPVVSIEPADEDDLETWFGYGIPRQIMRMGWKSTTGDDAVFLKAVSPSGRIIGLITAQSNDQDAYKIQYIETCLTASKTGVGTALVQEIVKTSLENGFNGKVTLDSVISATQFYLSLGFDFPEQPKERKYPQKRSTAQTQLLVLQPEKAMNVLSKAIPARLNAKTQTFSSPDTIKSVAYLMNSYDSITDTAKSVLTEFAGNVLGISADQMQEVFESKSLYEEVTSELYNAMIDQQLIRFDTTPFSIGEASRDDLNEWFSSPLNRTYNPDKWDEAISPQTRFLKVVSPTGRIVGLMAFTQDDNLKSLKIDLVDTCVTFPDDQIVKLLIRRLAHLSFMQWLEGRVSTEMNQQTDDTYKRLRFVKTDMSDNMLVLKPSDALHLIGSSYTFVDYKAFFPEFDRLPADAVISKLKSLSDKFNKLSYDDRAFVSVQLIKNYGVTPYQMAGIWSLMQDSEQSYRNVLEQFSFAVLDEQLVGQNLDMGEFVRVEKVAPGDIDSWYSGGIERFSPKVAWDEKVYDHDEMVLYKAVSPSGRIVGMVSLFVDGEVDAVQIGVLDVCSTVEESSVARELVKQVIRESFNRGFEGKVFIDSSISAMEFYRSLGFIELPERVNSFGLLPAAAEDILGVDTYSANEQVLKKYRQISTLDALEKLSGLMTNFKNLTSDDKTFIAAQIMNAYLLTPDQTEAMLNKFLQSEVDYRQGINSLYNILSDSWSARQNVEKDLSEDKPAIRPVFSSELPDTPLALPEGALPEMFDYATVLNKMIEIKKMLGSHLDTSFDKTLAEKPATVNLAKSFLRKHGIAVDIRVVSSDDPRVEGRTAFLLNNVIYVNENATRGEFWFYLPHEVSHILNDENKAQLHNSQQISYLKGLSQILISQARTMTDRLELREALYAMGVNMMYNALAYELDIHTAKLQLTQVGNDFLRNNNLPVFENVSKSYLYSVASSAYSMVRPKSLPEIASTIGSYARDAQLDEKEAVAKLRSFVMRNLIEQSINKARSSHNQVDDLLSSWIDIQFNRRFWQVNTAKIPKQIMPYIKQSVDAQGVVDIRDIQRIICQELSKYPDGTEKALLEKVLAQWIAELITENIAPLSDTNELPDVLQKKQANCSGYSNLFNMIASQFGLNTRIALLEVEYEGSLQLHAVNLVNLSNGKWEILDLVSSGAEIKRVYLRVNKGGQFVHEFISNEDFLSAEFDQIDGLSQDVIDAVTFNTRATVANGKGDIETALYNMNVAYELDPYSPYIASNLAEMIFANWLDSIKKFQGYPSQDEIFEKARTLYYEFDLERGGPDSWKNFYDTIMTTSQNMLSVGSVDGVNGPGGPNPFWKNNQLKKAGQNKQPDQQQPKPEDTQKTGDVKKTETPKDDDALLKHLDAQGALNRMNLQFQKTTIPKDPAKAIQQYQTTQMLGKGMNFNSARRLIQLGGQITALIQQQQFAKAEQMMMGLDPGFANRVMMQFPWIMAFMLEFYPEWWKGDDLRELARKARLPDEIRAMVKRQLTTVQPVSETSDRDEFRRYPRINPLWALFQKAQLAKRLKSGIDNNNLTDRQFRLLYELLEQDELPAVQDLSSAQKTVLFGKRDEILLENKPSVENGFLISEPFNRVPAADTIPLYQDMVKTVVEDHPHELVSVLADQPDRMVAGVDSKALKTSRGGLSVIGQDIFESVTDDEVIDFFNTKPQDNAVSEAITAVFTSNLLYKEKLFFLNNIIQSGMLDHTDRAVLSYLKKYYVDGDENTTFFKEAALALQGIVSNNDDYKDDLYYLASKLRTAQPGNLFYAMLRMNADSAYSEEETQITIPFPQTLSNTRTRLLDAAM